MSAAKFAQRREATGQTVRRGSINCVQAGGITQPSAAASCYEQVRERSIYGCPVPAYISSLLVVRLRPLRHSLIAVIGVQIAVEPPDRRLYGK